LSIGTHIDECLEQQADGTTLLVGDAGARLLTLLAIIAQPVFPSSVWLLAPENPIPLSCNSSISRI